jgi:hypothetical protein
MGQQKGKQKGAQQHAEGQHGDATHRRLIEQLHDSPQPEPLEDEVVRRREGEMAGGHRLGEDREQHDEAEKNSERNRLAIELERGRDHGPSDNRGSLHGVTGQREGRADNKTPGHRP